jgi:hypothetical protein
MKDILDKMVDAKTSPPIPPTIVKSGFLQGTYLDA